MKFRERSSGDIYEGHYITIDIDFNNRWQDRKQYSDLVEHFFEEFDPILESRDEDRSPINVKHHLDEASAGYIGFQSFSGECPECGQYVVEDYNYCPFCGQALKWDYSELLKLPKENWHE